MEKTPLSTRKFLLVYIAWWVVWAILQTDLLVGFGVKPTVAMIDSMISNLLIALSCGFILSNMRYYLPRKERYGYIVLLSLGLAGLCILISKLIVLPLAVYVMGDPMYKDFFTASKGIRFDFAFLQIGCICILSILWYTTEEEKLNRQRHGEAEKLAKEAELFKLRQQLAPHFLFNSLNSISALTGSQPERARKMIQQLSDFLRSNLKKEEQEWVPLSEELQYLELYLEIEKVRFGHRLSTEVVCDEKSLEARLPPMLLQPIVENAIKFGLYDTTDAVTISVRAAMDKGYVRVEVVNPFDPETSRPQKGTGFGLNSIQRRLYLLFARADLLETHAENNLFTTIVKIPQLQPAAIV